jgi:hypothetical protein
MGVEALKVDKPFQVKSRLLDKIGKSAGQVERMDNPYGYVWGHASNDDIVALNRLLKKDYTIFWAAEEFEANGKLLPPGTMIVQFREGLVSELLSIARELQVNFKGLMVKPEIKVYSLKLPKLGLYKSWKASMDEGWTRFVLEQFEFPYKSIFNQDIRKGNLDRNFDVIIFPSLDNKDIVNGISEKEIPPEYAGGIGEIGIKSIKTYIENGGTLITLNSAAEFGLKSLHLAVENKVDGLDRKDFFVPGSLLKVINNNTHPIAYGYQRDSAVFFRRSPVFSTKEGQNVITYPTHPLLSGWITGEQYLANQSALVDVSYDKGKVILIGFPVLYRSQSHGSFRYFFNSIFYSSAKLTDL